MKPKNCCSNDYKHNILYANKNQLLGNGGGNGCSTC